LSDQKLIELIRQGDNSRALDKLYKGFPQIRKLVLSKGGNEDDAKDVFQESLIIFFQKAKKPDFELTAAISTYLYSVSWYVWKDKLKKLNKNVSFDDIVNLDRDDESDIEYHLEKERKFEFVDEALTRLGEKCLKILKMFYYDKRNMDEIADVMSLSSAKVAKNQKYKCIERARKMAQKEYYQNQ